MNTLPSIKLDADVEAVMPSVKDWRQTLHQHPQTSYEETFAAGFIEQKLKEFGLEVHTGLAKTGVVGVLKGSKGGKSIGLRADIDALNILEENTFAYASKTSGKMHACGHDGHTAMLLGAAKVLSQRKNLAGDLVFIFQPAEEGGAGGDRMVKEGLFKKFAVETVWGMHNLPGLEIGHVAVRAGAIMASADEFSVKIHGQGSHAAMPHQSIDPVVIAAHMIQAFQTIVSRNLRPIEAGVVSVTMLKAGTAFNIIPETLELHGTFRSLNSEVRNLLIERIKQIAEGTALTFGAKATVSFSDHAYPVTINSEAETRFAVETARTFLGQDRVNGEAPPSMGAEDFAFMLQQKPGCYIFLGNGAKGQKGSEGLHTPKYDFNDEGAVYGVQYWISLSERLLQT